MNGKPSLHIDPVERTWILISVGILIVFAIAVTIAGFAMGIERLILLLQQQEGLRLTPVTRMDIFVAALGEKAALASQLLVHLLRQGGMKAAMDHNGRSLKAQMKQAGRLSARFALIVGDNERRGDPGDARFSVSAANIWRGIPFVAISLLAGLQTISPSYYEAASLDGASDWQQFRFVTLPLLTPIIAVVMTFSVLFTFTDFQLIYVLTRGGPLNATHLMATLSFQRAISGGALGEGAALATAMVPFLMAAILFSYFGLQRRAWQQGGSDR